MSRHNTPRIVLLALLFLAFWTSAGRTADITIGVVLPAEVPYYQSIHNTLLLRLHKAGYAHRISFAVQKPYPEPMSLTNAARKLIAYDVDMIIAYGAPAALAVMDERPSMPVIYSGVYDPLAAKIRGKKVTGISAKVSTSSLLRYLRGVVKMSTIGVLYSSKEADSLWQAKEIQRLAHQYGIKVEAMDLPRPQDARQMLTGRKIDAIFLTGSSIVAIASPAIMDIARSGMIPVGSFLLNHSASAVVSLSASPREQGEETANRVIKIMDGFSLEKIRTDTSHDIELIFNMREAAALGCRIPMELVTEATRLLQ